MSHRRRRSRQKNSLVGLWIGLGVGGGMLFLMLIVLLVTVSSNSSPQQPSHNSTNPANLLLGGGSSGAVDDGSPAFISNPQFLKDRHGQTLLRVNYELKRPQDIPAGRDLTFWLKSGSPGRYQAHLDAPQMFSRSKLKDRGTLDLPLYNFLKMPAQFGVRMPDAEVYWEAGGRRLSNTLTVPLPMNPDGLPTAPEIIEAQRQASRFQVNLSNAHYDGGFIPKLYVEIHPSRGEPEPPFQYVLVCKQVVLARRLFAGPAVERNAAEARRPDRRAIAHGLSFQLIVRTARGSPSPQPAPRRGNHFQYPEHPRPQPAVAETGSL